MSSIDDLRRALDAHAPATDADLIGRPAAVARRVTAVRRRRAAAGAVAAVAVIGGGSWLAAGLPGPEKAPGPAQEPTASVTEPPQGEAIFRPETEGLSLGARVVGSPGSATVSVGTVLPERPQFAVHCIPPAGSVGAGADMPWVTVEVRGWTALQVSCGSGGPPDDDPAAFLYGPGQEGDKPGLTLSFTSIDGSVRERRIPPGRNVSFDVRLTDAQGRSYEGPVDGVELGLGVYAGR